MRHMRPMPSMCHIRRIRRIRHMRRVRCSGSGTSNSNVVGNRLSVAIISSSITAGTILLLDLCFAFARRPLVDLSKRVPVHTEASYVAVALGAMTHQEVRQVIHELRQISHLSPKDFEARWLFGLRKLRSGVNSGKNISLAAAAARFLPRPLSAGFVTDRSAANGASAMSTARPEAELSGQEECGVVPALAGVPSLAASTPAGTATEREVNERCVDTCRGVDCDTNRSSVSAAFEGWTARDLVGSLTSRTEASAAGTAVAGAGSGSSAINLASVTLAMARLHVEQREALHQLLIGMFRRYVTHVTSVPRMRVTRSPACFEGGALGQRLLRAPLGA